MSIVVISSNCGCGCSDFTDPCTCPTPVVTGGSASGTKCSTFGGFNISATNSPTSYGASGLPAGLSVNSSTGHITGTPTAAGTFYATISASNCCGTGYATLTLTVADITCPMPTLKIDIITASKTKCGYDEFSGYVSSPPKIYLTKTFAGDARRTEYALSSCFTCHDFERWVYSGSNSYSRPSCTETKSASAARHTETNPSTNDCTDHLDSTYSAFDDILTATISGLSVGTAFGESFSATEHRLTGIFVSCDTATNQRTSGTDITCTLSAEYTTTTLISDVQAALPASYPGTFAGTGTSVAVTQLTTDELTYSEQRGKYKWVLPSLTGIGSYSFTWKEGGVSKSYTWNGTDTETALSAEIIAGLNASVDITDLVVTCGC